jgi:hypothetical protein
VSEVDMKGSEEAAERFLAPIPGESVVYFQENPHGPIPLIRAAIITIVGRGRGSILDFESGVVSLAVLKPDEASYVKLSHVNGVRHSSAPKAGCWSRTKEVRAVL